MAKIENGFSSMSSRNPGEDRLVQYLKENLPDSYSVITNFFVRSSQEGVVRDSQEIDAVVIGPHGIFVIENKHYAGELIGDDEWWTHNGRRIIPPPIPIEYKAKMVSSLLKAADERLSRVFVIACVSLSHNNASVKRISGQFASKVFTLKPNYHELKDYLLRSDVFGNKVFNTSGVRTELVNLFVKGTVKPNVNHPSQFGYYTVDSLLNESDRRQEFIVHPSGAQLANLKKRLSVVYVYDSNLSEDENDSNRKKAENARLALLQIPPSEHIVAHEFEFDDDSWQMRVVTDAMPSQTLSKKALSEALTSEERDVLARDVIKGVNYIHSHRIVHRGLSPESIYVVGGKARIGDFDRSYFDLHQELDYTVLPGRAAYDPFTAVELRSGKSTKASDVYSVACILYWLYCGEQPFPDEGSFRNSGGRLSPGRMPSVVAGTKNRRVPVWLDDFCARNVTLLPRERDQDLSELVATLDKNENVSGAPPDAEEGTRPFNLEAVKPGDILLDYVVSAKLGSGSAGRVFKVKHKNQGDAVFALKVYPDKTYEDMVTREYLTLKDFQHPNIVRFVWNGSLQGGLPFTLMSYEEGEPLSHYAPGNSASTKRLTLDLISRLTAEILSALQHLQTQLAEPVIHGDIKPANIIRRTDGSFVLIDFNIAGKAAEQDSQSGSHAYMAPINDEDSAETLLSRDTFSFGVVLYELVCGEHPWRETRMVDPTVLPKHPWEYRKDIKKSFADFIARAVQPEYSRRFKDAQEMLVAFQAIKQLEEDEDLTGAGLDPKPQSTSNDALATVEQVGEKVVSAWIAAGPESTGEPEEVEPDYLIPALRSDIPLRKGESELVGALHPYQYPTVTRHIKTSEFVKFLTSIYSQAHQGNSGTRSNADDPDFAHLTFVSTRLNERLIPDILEGKYRLVIVTGNAGDGKTAFIRSMEREFPDRVILDHGNGSRFSIHGVPFQSNYDGSQDEGDTDNLQVLDDFLQPFKNVKDYQSVQVGRVIAINEGRLREFLQHQDGYGDLASDIEDYFANEGRSTLPAGVLVINLNLRSVVATTDPETGEQQLSLFGRQLRALVNPAFWNDCHTCPVSASCPIRFNAQTFNDPAVSDEVILRLEWLMRTIVLQREFHVTIRDLRSFLGYLITQDYTCSDIIESKPDDPFAILDKTFLGIGEIRQGDVTDQRQSGSLKDRMVEKFRQLDIANVPVPDWDRELFYNKLNPENYIAFANREFSVLKLLDRARDHDPVRAQRYLIRHHYYENRSSKAKEQKGREDFRKRLPYRHLSTFWEIVSEPHASDEMESSMKDLLSAVAESVARLEECDVKDLFQKNLVLAASQAKDKSARSYRLFPLQGFSIAPERPEILVQYLEYNPLSVVLSRTGIGDRDGAKLEIGLDLFELLHFVKAGFRPSVSDLQGRFIELEIFKQRLYKEPYTEVVVTSDNRNFHKIRLNVAEGKLEYEKI